MFFFLSKALYFLIQPVNWFFGAFVLAVLAKNPRRKKKWLMYSFLIFVFFNNHFLFNLCMRAWEPDYPQITEQYDVGILLGGYSNFYVDKENDYYTFNERANRLTQTLELYRKGNIKKILLSGGSGNILSAAPSEAKEAKVLLMKMGVPEEDLILEPESRNTRENALYSKAILQKEYPKAKCLLITSAFHMRRSKACFEKIGLSYDAHCVDYIGERIRPHLESTIIPDRKGFYQWDVLMKEMVGYMTYWLRGYV